MPAYYLDTSALVKRYIYEIGSVWISQIVDRAAGNTLLLSRLTGVEFVAALTRRMRGGSIAQSEVARQLMLFRRHWQQDYLISSVADNIIDDAMHIAERYTLRSYDATHLATALSLNRDRLLHGLPTLIFLSADTEQLAAARAEGLSIDDPNHHP